MRIRFRLGLRGALVGLMALCLALSVQARAQQTGKRTPAFLLVEAESEPQGQIAADRMASAGKYVHRDGDYQPNFLSSIPSTLGEEITVWVRYRGVAVQLKAVAADGKQTELQWLYDAPAKFVWASFGTFKRAQLGSKALIIRAAGGDAHSGVDAVVFAAEKTFDPKTAMPAILPDPLRVTVAWDISVAHATPLSYGLNAFHGFDPHSAADAAYQKQMDYIHPGLVRLHSWDMLGDSTQIPDGWLDAAKHTWDAAKIKRALDGAYAYGPAVILNLPGWPDWMAKDRNGLLAADQQERYAALCADFVKIVNKDLKRHILYWEITNEQDGPYYQNFHTEGGKGGLKDPARPDQVDALVALYNRCALAMKRVDPTIKTGGPAVARPDFTDFLTRFVRGTAANLDFCSYHAYASGSKSDSDAAIFDHSEAYGKFAGSIIAILKKEIPQRSVPAFLDEYNISWTWETRDPRMTDNRGAVYDALVVAASILNGASGTTAWNDKDGIYGKMDGEDHLRLPGQGLHLLNAYGIGDCVRTSTQDSRTIIAYAVKSAKHHALWIINRSNDAQPVTITCAGWKAGAVAREYRISAAGFTSKPIPWDGSSQKMVAPECSVTVYTFGTE